MSNVPPYYPLTTDFKTNEGVQSFMLRLAAINCYPRLYVAKDIGLHSFECRMAMENVERLAEVSRHSTEIVASRAALITSERTITISGMDLPARSMIQLCSRLCCSCLLEHGYHHMVWNLPAVAACPFCKSLLIEACPVCKVRLRWNRDDLLKCPKGHPLDAKLDIPISERADRVKISRIIYEKLGEKPQWSSEQEKLSPIIRGLGLSDYLDLLKILDLFHTDAAIGPSRELVDYRLWRSVSLADQWPQKLNEILQQHYSLKPGGSKPLLFSASISGKLLSRRQNADISYKIFEEAANAFVAANQIVVHGRNRYGRDTDRTLTINVAARRLKVHPSTFVRMTERLGISLIQWDRGLTLRIRKVDLDKMRKEERLEIVVAKRIARRLGIANTLPPKMIKRGLFGLEAMNRCSDVKRVKWFVTEEELDGFVRRVQSVLDAAEPDLKCRRWAGFRVKYRPTNIDLVDVIEGLLAGRVRASSGEPSHLGQIKFCEEDLLRLTYAQERSSSVSDQVGLLKAHQHEVTSTRLTPICP
jgi:hypothetical protein